MYKCPVSTVRCHHVTAGIRVVTGLALPFTTSSPVGNHVAPGPRVDVTRRLGLAPWAVRTTYCAVVQNIIHYPKEDPVSTSEYSGPAHLNPDLLPTI